MTAITGRMIGPAICTALGIDVKHTRTIDIHIAANEVVTVTVERLMQDCETKQFASELERYVLVEKANAQPDLRHLGMDLGNAGIPESVSSTEESHA